MNARPQSYKRAPRTAKEADRVEYQRQWHLASKHPATTRGEAARRWIADRRAARLAAAIARPPRKPYQPRPPRAPLSAEERHARHERHKEICREYYRRNRAAILARTANRRLADPTARDRAAAAYRQKTAAARAVRREKYAQWLADPTPTFRSLAALPLSSRRKIVQRDRARRRAASKALAKKP